MYARKSPLQPAPTLTIDRDRCTGDGDCVMACPRNVLAIRTVLAVVGDDGVPRQRTQPFVVDYNACDGCQLCVTACPTAAIGVQSPEPPRPINIGRRRAGLERRPLRVAGGSAWI